MPAKKSLSQYKKECPHIVADLLVPGMSIRRTAEKNGVSVTKVQNIAHAIRDADSVSRPAVGAAGTQLWLADKLRLYPQLRDRLSATATTTSIAKEFSISWNTAKLVQLAWIEWCQREAAADDAASAADAAQREEEEVIDLPEIDDDCFEW